MRYAIVAAALLVSGCSTLPAAQMQLPSHLAMQQAEPIHGITGWTHGRYHSGGYQGGYERSERRMTFFDTFDRRAGHATFTVSGPQISSVIEARCRMREKALQFGGASFTTKPMAYRCDFLSDGLPFPARFEIHESVSNLQSALSQYERRGEIALGGEVLQIRSVHTLEGTPLTTAAPIGYRFEQHGRVIGAIETNGTPRLFVAAGTDPGVKRTMFIGAMALALLWDPADSQLGEI